MRKRRKGQIIPFKEADLSQGRSWVLDRDYANFYEKALFVKPTWRPLRGEHDCSALRAMLLSAVNTL